MTKIVGAHNHIDELSESNMDEFVGGIRGALYAFLGQSVRVDISGAAHTPSPEAIESLSAEIHEVYCQYHLDIRGTEYWTKGDYSLLDEATKEFDRYMARFILNNFVQQR